MARKERHFARDNAKLRTARTAFFYLYDRLRLDRMCEAFADIVRSSAKIHFDLLARISEPAECFGSLSSYGTACSQRRFAETRRFSILFVRSGPKRQSIK